MRYNEMNKFLLMVRDYIQENPFLNKQQREKLIYRLMINQGISEEDKKRDFSDDGTFNRLIYYFQNRQNINAFVSPRWKYFCQFLNEKGQFDKTAEAIKIYVPQDAKHLELSARLIFDFLDKNNYCHCSKIARKVRFDDIVIRMKDKNEALQLMNFIKNNKYIQEGLIKPNPFAFSQDNIAMACDRNMSYNSTVSSLINLYMNYIQENNAYDRVSIEDYINFVNIYFRFHFVNYNDLSDTITDFGIEGADYNDLSSNEKIVNIRDIIELHLKSMDPSYSKEDYFANYEERLDVRNIVHKANKIKEERSKDKLINPEGIDDTDFLLFNSINLLMNKYQDFDYAIKVIQKYVDTGMQEYVTRDFNLRKTLSEKGFDRKLRDKLRFEVCTVKDYYFQKLNAFNEHVLNNAIYDTYRKYQEQYENNNINVDGFSWAREAILKYIKTNDASGFTRNNNVRRNIINFINPKIVYDTITNTTGKRITNEDDLIISINEYIKNVIMNRYSLSQKKKAS